MCYAKDVVAVVTNEGKLDPHILVIGTPEPREVTVKPTNDDRNIVPLKENAVAVVGGKTVSPVTV